MVAFHKDFSEYATCSRCGLKKLCGKVGRHMVCWSCSQKNFNGLRNYNKELINDDT